MRYARVLGMRGAVCLAAAVLLSGALSTGVEAATVIPMTVQTLSDYAGQVIVGDVVSVRSYWAQNPRRIESEVVFQNVEYLKGKLADSKATFTLIVPGGKVGDWQMRVSCAPTFAQGEKCVLFLLPTYKTFPVVGLNQGCFKVKPDEGGVERVYGASLEAVTGMDKEGFVQIAANEEKDVRQHLVAENNLRVKTPAQPAAAAAQAMSLQDFRAMIQPLLDASKAQNLTTPAGRPDLSGYIPVPLKQASSPSKVSTNGAGLRSGRALPRKVDVPPQPPRVQPPALGESAKEVQR